MYKEALERAKELLNKEGLSKGSYPNREVCEEIFPELVENEDERIRREIAELISETGVKEWIAWFEKHCPRKPSLEESNCEMIGKINDALKTFTMLNQRNIKLTNGTCEL